MAHCFVANYIIDAQSVSKAVEAKNIGREGCPPLNHPSSESNPEGKSQPVTNERFLTLADVAEILNISASQSYALVRSGELQGIQIGGRNQWRVERSKLEEYIDQAYQRTEVSLTDLPSTLPSDA